MANFFHIAQVRLQSLKNIKYSNETAETENKFKLKQFKVAPYSYGAVHIDIDYRYTYRPEHEKSKYLAFRFLCEIIC